MVEFSMVMYSSTLVVIMFSEKQSDINDYPLSVTLALSIHSVHLQQVHKFHFIKKFYKYKI